MKYYVVSLLALFLLLVLQTPQAIAGSFARGGFASRGFVAGTGPHRFVSPRVIIINPGHARFVHVSPFARHVIIAPRPFFCFHHGIGFFDEPSFFNHLHRFDGLSFENIPQVIVSHGSQTVFLGS